VRIMSTFIPRPSDSTGARPPAVELGHRLSGGFQSVYLDVLAPAGGSRAGTGDGRHVNYSVMVIVVVLSVVFILSGFLHLLARCLGRRRRQLIAPAQHSPLVSALHGQLQHLFHLHDAGVEQAFIDTLPVFAYGSIRGLKDSADCAVCLNEFADDDRLRLLPKCKHAFHLKCIDTWLLSHSTCPLCRRSLLPDHPVLAPSTSHHRHGEHTEAIDTEMATTASEIIHSNRLPCTEDPHLTNSRSSSRITTSLHGSNSFRICEPLPPAPGSENEIQEIHETLQTEELIEAEIHDLQTPSPAAPTIRVMDAHGTERVLKVELGKVAACTVTSHESKLTKKGARSYSMGSYEYIVDPTSWELTIAPTPYPGRPSPPSKLSHRSALSDSIPELASNELFWTSRGVYSLSRFRSALLTPIMSSDSNAGSSPFLDHTSYSPSQGGDRWIDIDIERGEVIEAPGPIIESHSTTCSSSPAVGAAREEGSSDASFKQRSSSLGRIGLPEGFELSCFRRSLSGTLAGRETGCEGFVSKDVDDPLGGDGSVQQGASVSRKFSLNWLMGRNKRIVFSAASPSPVPPAV
jgi:hypothetical protein